MTRWLLLVVVFVASGAANAAEAVILIHGLARNSGSMWKLERELKQAGYLVVNLSYPSRSDCIAKLGSSAIGNALNRPDVKSCDRIHFVTHSLGGILVRDYVKRYQIPQLGRVVMLGPPNQGSEVVDRLKNWTLFRIVSGPAGMELGTDNGSVPNQLGPVSFELGVIAGDRSVNWINSLMIRGPDDGKVSVERTKVAGMKECIVLHVTHPMIMKRSQVISATLRFLKTGSFQVPRSSE